MKNVEDGSIKKIGYIFTALFIWYGIAWFVFPLFVKNIDVLRSGTNIPSLSTVSYIIGGLSILIAILILVGTYISVKDEKIY